jgi:hypothetical protein
LRLFDNGNREIWFQWWRLAGQIALPKSLLESQFRRASKSLKELKLLAALGVWLSGHFKRLNSPCHPFAFRTLAALPGE